MPALTSVSVHAREQHHVGPLPADTQVLGSEALGLLEICISRFPVVWRSWIDVAGWRHLQRIGLHCDIRLLTFPNEVDTSDWHTCSIREMLHEGSDLGQWKIEVLITN